MENNKRESRASAVSVGKKLKEAREKKSLSVDQVQKQTRIHSTVIVALEEGKPIDTLTETYIRSFLRKYAQFLGISATELLKEYFPANAESPILPLPAQNNVLPKETQATPKFIYMTGLAVAALLSLLLLIFIVGKVSTAVKKAPLFQKKSAPSTVAKKKTSQSTKTVQKKQPAAKSKSGTKEFVPRATPLILEIRVKEAVMVKLKKDGMIFFDSVLPAGLVEKTVANSSIELDIHKAGSLDLTINGRPIVLQDKNANVSLEITRKGIKIKTI